MLINIFIKEKILLIQLTLLFPDYRIMTTNKKNFIQKDSTEEENIRINTTKITTNFRWIIIIMETITLTEMGNKLTSTKKIIILNPTHLHLSDKAKIF